MGVYIEGMEMPTEGTVITIYKLKGKFYASMHRGELCSLIPVPSHGDLIERDALTISTYVPIDGKPYRYIHIDNIKSAPIIIPADKAEDGE